MHQPSFTVRLIRHAALGLIATGLLAANAAAQTWPSKPVRLLVPYAAGGTTDQMARLLGKGVGDLLGQPVIIENRPGASGVIAVDVAARAAPDGYTLVLGNSSPNAILPALGARMPYDALKDLAPISLVARTPLIVAINPQVPARTLAEFIDLAKKKPGAINFGSTGVGAGSHLATELFMFQAGIKMVHVPFNGGAPSVTALVRGDTQVSFITGLDGMAQWKAGGIRYIAISSPKRFSMLPDLPSIGETIAGFNADVWFGILAPARTPADVRERLQLAIQQVIAEPNYQKSIREKIAEPESSTQEGLAKIIRDEFDLWKRVQKETGLKVE